MTAPLSAEDYDHIRADVHTAVLEAQQHDPPVTMEILFRLLDEVGKLAGDHHEAAMRWRPGRAPVDYRRLVRNWAAALLRDVQARATTKVPYGEPREMEYELTLDADERGGR